MDTKTVHSDVKTESKRLGGYFIGQPKQVHPALFQQDDFTDDDILRIITAFETECGEQEVTMAAVDSACTLASAVVEMECGEVGNDGQGRMGEETADSRTNLLEEKVGEGQPQEVLATVASKGQEGTPAIPACVLNGLNGVTGQMGDDAEWQGTAKELPTFYATAADINTTSLAQYVHSLEVAHPELCFAPGLKIVIPVTSLPPRPSKGVAVTEYRSQVLEAAESGRWGCYSLHQYKRAMSGRFRTARTRPNMNEDGYWDRVGRVRGRHTLQLFYANDIHTSYTAHVAGGKVPLWDMNNMKSPLTDAMLLLGESAIPGVSTSYCYERVPGSTFPIHVEDWLLYSANLLTHGQPMVWYLLPEKDAAAVDEVLAAAFPNDYEVCPLAARHKLFLLHPRLLAGMDLHRTYQKQGEIVVTFPQAYHQGWSTGCSFAEAVNFATPLWLDRPCPLSCTPPCTGPDGGLPPLSGEIWAQLKEKVANSPYDWGPTSGKSKGKGRKRLSFGAQIETPWEGSSDEISLAELFRTHTPKRPKVTEGETVGKEGDAEGKMADACVDTSEPNSVAPPSQSSAAEIRDTQATAPGRSTQQESTCRHSAPDSEAEKSGNLASFPYVKAPTTPANGGHQPSVLRFGFGAPMPHGPPPPPPGFRPHTGSSNGWSHPPRHIPSPAFPTPPSSHQPHAHQTAATPTVVHGSRPRAIAGGGNLDSWYGRVYSPFTLPPPHNRFIHWQPPMPGPPAVVQPPYNPPAHHQPQPPSLYRPWEFQPSHESTPPPTNRQGPNFRGYPYQPMESSHPAIYGNPAGYGMHPYAPPLTHTIPLHRPLKPKPGYCLGERQKFDEGIGAGGFPAFSFKRQLPARGPSGATLFLGTTAVCLTGLLIMGQGNRERRVIKLEKVANRIALVPLLQAEEDRRYLRARAQGQEYEAKIMAGVDGWQVGEKVYHTDRWVPPYMPSPLGKAP